MKVTISFVLALLISGGSSTFMKNQYAVDVENLEPCPNNEQIGKPIRNVSFLHFNRTHKSLNYDFTYSQPLDEKVAGSIVVERWGDGGWIKMPFTGVQSNICEYVSRHFRAFWINFHKNIGVQHPDRCPIPAGNYSVRNLVVDASSFSLPFFSGSFRFTTLFFDQETKTQIFCMAFIIKITEQF